MAGTQMWSVQRDFIIAAFILSILGDIALAAVKSMTSTFSFCISPKYVYESREKRQVLGFKEGQLCLIIHNRKDC